MIKSLEDAKAWVKARTSSALKPGNVQFNDSVAKGYLSIYKEFEDGSRETMLENDPNVITFDSRRHHLAFLHDTTVVQDILSSFKVGTGGAVGDDSGGNTNVRVITPDPTRNDLYTPISLPFNTSIDIFPSQDETPPILDEVYLRIVFSLQQDDANGLRINECGIFKQRGDMFNHKTFVSIEKSESFSLIFDWKIRYI